MDYQNNSYPGGYAQNVQALDWDADFAAQESEKSPLLPEGDYWFEIVKVERGHHGGSAKIPACNKATVTFRILAPQGEAIIKENYFLLSDEWRMELMTAFFRSIGVAKQGESRVKPVWSNEIAGRRGVCHIAPRSYQYEGKTCQTNDLKKLYPAWDQPVVEPVTPAAPPAYQPGAQGGYAPQPQGYQPPQGGYHPNGGYRGGAY